MGFLNQTDTQETTPETEFLNNSNTYNDHFLLNILQAYSNWLHQMGECLISGLGGFSYLECAGSIFSK